MDFMALPVLVLSDFVPNNTGVVALGKKLAVLFDHTGLLVILPSSKSSVIMVCACVMAVKHIKQPNRKNLGSSLFMPVYLYSIGFIL